MWISHLFSASHIADPRDGCHISLPLSAAPLQPTLKLLKSVMTYNFFPLYLWLQHLQWLCITSYLYRSSNLVPFLRNAFGNPGTGKTTALHAGLSLLGANPVRFIARVTKEKIVQMCCTSSLPLGVDDPHSKMDIGKVAVELFGGGIIATMGGGANEPTATAILTAI